MSRVDDQRMQEMNEAKLRQKKDTEKRLNEKQLDKSFKEVMTNRSRRRNAQETERLRHSGTQAKEKQNEGKRILDRVAKRPDPSEKELARRAALNQAMHGGMQKRRGVDAEEARQAESSRVAELSDNNEVEETFVDTEVRTEEEHEVERTEEQQAEIEARHGDAGPVERREQNQQRRQGQQSQGQDERRAEGAEATSGPRGGAAQTLPPEVVRQLVQTIYKAVNADGRTHLRIELKGGVLDGVKLEVRTNGKRVKCSFSNCSRELAGSLKRAQKGLAQALGKRGLALDKLEAR